MQTKLFKSCIEWNPEEVCLENSITTDLHETYEQAESICKIIQRDGLGGEGKIFPIKTWVE